MNFEFQRRGLLLVISAPSGGGKSVVVERLRAAAPELVYSVSVTSRPPRGHEIDGRDYHFVSRARFEDMIRENRFYEWAEVHGNFYGSRADTIHEALERGLDVLMDIDVQGGMALKQRSPDAVLVFLMPPSMSTLEERLRGRATDSEEQIRLRLENARREIEHWPRYDYVVMNQDLDRTVEAVIHILHAERCRAARLTGMQHRQAPS